MIFVERPYDKSKKILPLEISRYPQQRQHKIEIPTDYTYCPSVQPTPTNLKLVYKVWKTLT
jgi:hypothetical protein